MNRKIVILGAMFFLIFSCRDKNNMNEVVYHTDTLYYKDGKIKSISSFRNDKKHGKEYLYAEDGGDLAFYTYIDGVLNGNCWSHPKYADTSNGHIYMYDNGKKVIEWYHGIKDDGTKLLEYFNYRNGERVHAGTIFFSPSASDSILNYYYVAVPLFDTITNKEDYSLEILLPRPISLFPSVRILLSVISQNDTLLNIDTATTSKEIFIPIKKYNTDINKITGEIIYLSNIMTDENGELEIKIHRMNFYKWLVVTEKFNKETKDKAPISRKRPLVRK